MPAWRALAGAPPCRRDQRTPHPASTNTGAAYQALTGTVPLSHVAEAGLFTDGITRLLDRYGYTWPALFSSLRAAGPAGLISLVRAAENERPPPLGNKHDDATTVYLRQF